MTFNVRSTTTRWLLAAVATVMLLMLVTPAIAHTGRTTMTRQGVCTVGASSGHTGGQMWGVTEELVDAWAGNCSRVQVCLYWAYDAARTSYGGTCATSTWYASANSPSGTYIYPRHSNHYGRAANATTYTYMGSIYH